MTSLPPDEVLERQLTTSAQQLSDAFETGMEDWARAVMEGEDVNNPTSDVEVTSANVERQFDAPNGIYHLQVVTSGNVKYTYTRTDTWDGPDADGTPARLSYQNNNSASLKFIYDPSGRAWQPSRCLGGDFVTHLGLDLRFDWMRFLLQAMSFKVGTSDTDDDGECMAGGLVPLK